LGLSKSLVRHFSNLRSSPTLHCLVLSLSFHPQRFLMLLKPILSSHPHAYGGRPVSILLFSRALSPFSILHCKLSPFTPSRKMLAHIVLVAAAAKERNSLPVRIAIPACAIASSSPAPDSPIAIYYALPRSYFQQMNA
jgi:hypothetical protein